MLRLCKKKEKTAAKKEKQSSRSRVGKTSSQLNDEPESRRNVAEGHVLKKKEGLSGAKEEKAFAVEGNHPPS